MKRVILVLVVGILQTLLIAGIAHAQTSDLSENFDSFDETKWSKGDHNLGRSYLDPNNVSVSSGNLEIKLPANSLDGGEIKSEGLYSYGSYSARMKLPHAPLLDYGLLPLRTSGLRQRDRHRDLQRRFTQDHVQHVRSWQTDPHTDNDASLRSHHRLPRLPL